MARRPNVILIVADDLGYGDLAIFGNPVVRTPHLDALAHGGVLLSQHYSGSPICAPARAASRATGSAMSASHAAMRRR